MGLQEVAQIVVPGALALTGSLYGASRAGSNVEKAELRTVLDEATSLLSRAGNQLGQAYRQYTGNVTETTPEGEEELRQLKAVEVEVAELRGKLVMRTPDSSPIAVHYFNAQLALGRAVRVFVIADRWPTARANRYDLAAEEKKAHDAEEDFVREHGLFLEAAQRHLRPWGRRRLGVPRSR